MIKFKFDLSRMKRALVKGAEPEYLQQLISVANAALADLKAETPKDTGRAAAGWSYRLEGDAVILENDVAYVKLLNAGSSQQAPAFFIEHIVLKYGKPLGSIVTYT